MSERTVFQTMVKEDIDRWDLTESEGQLKNLMFTQKDFLMIALPRGDYAGVIFLFLATRYRTPYKADVKAFWTMMDNFKIIPVKYAAEAFVHLEEYMQMPVDPIYRARQSKAPLRWGKLEIHLQPTPVFDHPQANSRGNNP